MSSKPRRDLRRLALAVSKSSIVTRALGLALRIGVAEKFGPGRCEQQNFLPGQVVQVGPENLSGRTAGACAWMISDEPAPIRIPPANRIAATIFVS
jgi:hypothetical protein